MQIISMSHWLSTDGAITANPHGRHQPMAASEQARSPAKVEGELRIFQSTISPHNHQATQAGYRSVRQAKILPVPIGHGTVLISYFSTLRPYANESRRTNDTGPMSRMVCCLPPIPALLGYAGTNHEKARVNAVHTLL